MSVFSFSLPLAQVHYLHCLLTLSVICPPHPLAFSCVLSSCILRPLLPAFFRIIAKVLSHHISSLSIHFSLFVSPHCPLVLPAFSTFLLNLSPTSHPSNHLSVSLSIVGPSTVEHATLTLWLFVSSSQKCDLSFLHSSLFLLIYIFYAFPTLILSHLSMFSYPILFSCLNFCSPTFSPFYQGLVAVLRSIFWNSLPYQGYFTLGVQTPLSFRMACVSALSTDFNTVQVPV